MVIVTGFRAMHTCPTCDAEYEETLADCPECGGDAEVFRCGRCAENYQGAPTCPACGAARAPLPCATHPDRLARGSCVVCGRALCRECSADEQRAYLCDDHRAVRVIEGWAQVYSTTRDFEAMLVQQNLQADGIDAQIYSQRDRTFSVDLGELSIIRLLVPVWEYESAVDVIRTHMEPEGEVAFACPACGDPHEPGARECSACGAGLE